MYAVICAAGAGTRMGQNKALCRISDDETFLMHIVRTLNLCGIQQIIVVTGAQSDKVVHTHKKLNVVWAKNDQWQSTYMLESLVCGLQKVPENINIIHWPVDCLFIHPEDLEGLINAPESPLAVLCWHNEPGHPMRISAQMVDFLRNSHHRYASLREFVEQHECLRIEAHHPSLMNCNDRIALDAFIGGQD